MKAQVPTRCRVEVGSGVAAVGAKTGSGDVSRDCLRD